MWWKVRHPERFAVYILVHRVSTHLISFFGYRCKKVDPVVVVGNVAVQHLPVVLPVAAVRVAVWGDHNSNNIGFIECRDDSVLSL